MIGRPFRSHWRMATRSPRLSKSRSSANRPFGYGDEATFHPTFLYESLWCLAAFGVLVWADRRFQLGHGRVVALYIMLYTLGRGWIETLRIDTVELEDVGGLRFNVWTSLVLFVAALIWFVVSARRQPGREVQVYAEGRGPAAEVEPAVPDAGPQP